MNEQSKKTKVFISYSHQDQGWKDRLVSHLRVFERQGLLEVWDTSEMPPGSDWAKEIQKSIQDADVAITLISPDFLASDFIVEKELSSLFDRRKKEGLLVLPIVVRPCQWTFIPELAQLQFLNADAVPLSAMSNSEADLTIAAIAERVAELAGALREHASTTEPPKKSKSQHGRTVVKPSADGSYFISHSKIDGDFAELLKLKMEKEGYSGWIDTDRLSPGVDWRQEIDHAIRNAVALIAIMSPEARASEYVTYEWAFAWGCGIKIIPIMLRPTPLHPRLAILQYIDFSTRSSRPWLKLYQVLEEVRSSKEPLQDRARLKQNQAINHTESG